MKIMSAIPDSNTPDGESHARRAAAEWLARRDRGFTPEEEQAFRVWLGGSLKHTAAFAEMESTWDEFLLARSDPETLAMAREVDEDTRTVQKRPRRIAPWVAFAAAAALALGGTLVWQRQQSSGPGPSLQQLAGATPHYEVLPSGARRVSFPDGSKADVRDDSEVRPEFTATERRVRLVAGEAHFTVVPDSARPFLVVAGDIHVRAVGTAFNVRHANGGLEVMVTEGRVRVDGAAPEAPQARESLVAAGERAIVQRVAAAEKPRIVIEPATPADIHAAFSWRSPRLVFERTPLEQAVNAFSRHSPGGPGGTLVIGDPSLRGRLLGGSFRASQLEAFIRVLEQSADIRVERRGDEIVLLPAH